MKSHLLGSRTDALMTPGGLASALSRPGMLVNRLLQKGTQVNRTRAGVRAVLLRSGLFGVRGGSLRVGGSGAGFWGGTAVLRLSTNASSSLPAQKNQIATAWSLRLAGLLALTIAALLALGASSASAATTRQLQSQITEADGVPFAEPTGLAVDSADDLWVADTGFSPIDKFDSLGATA